MNPEHLSQLKEELLRCEALPPAEREAHLVELSRTAPELERELRSLLGQVPLITNASPLDLLDPGPHGSDVAPALRQIGPYRLLDVLGVGGMGIVYRAEQREPLRREVAIKLLRGGLDPTRILARFTAEQRAMALLEHPAIARILDAGSDVDGMPYLVTELVRGAPISDYCRDHRLSVPQVLRLFIEVCRAVQHAQQKGIIHRDLKPSNILVAEIDGAPRPKVIDFGIARILEEETGAGTTLTAEGQVIGTLGYMSPEQAAGARGIDTRTDVYSLGAVLYELLTGSLPHALDGMGVGEALSILAREQPRPFRALPSKPRTLDGELETIVMKALAREPERRYEGAGALADDIERYVRHDAILARPPSAAYVLKKLIRRNRTAVTAGAIVLAALVLSTAISIGFAVNEARQKRAAVQAAARAAAIKDFLIKTLQSEQPELEGTQGMLVTDAILKGVERLQSGALADQPETRADILGASADILRSQGRGDVALPLAEETVRILGQLHRGDDPDLARGLHGLAVIDVDQGRTLQADSLFTRALAMQRRLAHGDDPDVAESLNDLGTLRLNEGRGVDAESLLTLALVMRQRLFPGDDQRVESSLSDLGMMRWMTGDPQAADSLLTLALAMQRRIFRGDHLDVARGMDNLATARSALGRRAEADSLWLGALAMRRRLFKTDHPDLADGLMSVALTRRTPEEGEPYMVEALAMARRIYKGDHPVVATMLNNLGFIRQSMNHTSEAEPLYVEAVGIEDRLRKEDHPEVLFYLASLASARVDLRRWADAEPVAVRALAMCDRMHLEDSSQWVRAKTFLGAARYGLGRPTEGRRLFDEAIEFYRRNEPGGSRYFARLLWRSASARMSAGDVSGALREFEAAVAMADTVLPPTHRDLKRYRESLAACRNAAHRMSAVTRGSAATHDAD